MEDDIDDFDISTVKLSLGRNFPSMSRSKIDWRFLSWFSLLLDNSNIISVVVRLSVDVLGFPCSLVLKVRSVANFVGMKMGSIHWDCR